MLVTTASVPLVQPQAISMFLVNTTLAPTLSVSVSSSRSLWYLVMRNLSESFRAFPWRSVSSASNDTGSVLRVARNLLFHSFRLVSGNR